MREKSERREEKRTKRQNEETRKKETNVRKLITSRNSVLEQIEILQYNKLKVLRKDLLLRRR